MVWQCLVGAFSHQNGGFMKQISQKSHPGTLTTRLLKVVFDFWSFTRRSFASRVPKQTLSGWCRVYMSMHISSSSYCEWRHQHKNSGIFYDVALKGILSNKWYTYPIYINVYIYIYIRKVYVSIWLLLMNYHKLSQPFRMQKALGPTPVYIFIHTVYIIWYIYIYYCITVYLCLFVCMICFINFIYLYLWFIY